jgi:heme/copper-type cytochrome/quinol oxidase subunit 2
VYPENIMFGAEMREMLVQVVTSWQVLVVTIFLLLYVSLVKYVAKTRRRRYENHPSSPRRKKKFARVAESKGPEIVSGDDELGLEDTSKK